MRLFLFIIELCWCVINGCQPQRVQWLPVDFITNHAHGERLLRAGWWASFFLSLSQVLAQLDVLLALFAEPKAMELCELAKKGKLKHSDEAVDAVPRALELCFLGLVG